MRNLRESIFQIESGKGRYQIQLLAFLCGGDLSVTIIGGETPHIGAVCLAQFEEERMSATVSTICVYGHRDDQVAMACAKKLSSRLRCTVTVSVGIHIDNATLEEIEILNQNCMDCVEKLQERVLTQQHDMNLDNNI